MMQVNTKWLHVLLPNLLKNVQSFVDAKVDFGLPGASQVVGGPSITYLLTPKQIRPPRSVIPHIILRKSGFPSRVSTKVPAIRGKVDDDENYSEHGDGSPDTCQRATDAAIALPMVPVGLTCLN